MKRKTYLVRVQGTELWIKILKCDLEELRKAYRITEEECGDEVYIRCDYGDES
jgi:hypothetical protein